MQNYNCGRKTYLDLEELLLYLSKRPEIRGLNIWLCKMPEINLHQSLPRAIRLESIDDKRRLDRMDRRSIALAKHIIADS